MWDGLEARPEAVMVPAKIGDEERPQGTARGSEGSRQLAHMVQYRGGKYHTGGGKSPTHHQVEESLVQHDTRALARHSAARINLTYENFERGNLQLPRGKRRVQPSTDFVGH